MNAKNVTVAADQIDPLISFRSAGRRIGKSAPTISRWAAAGILDGVLRASDGRPLGIKKSAFDRFINQSHEIHL